MGLLDFLKKNKPAGPAAATPIAQPSASAPREAAEEPSSAVPVSQGGAAETLPADAEPPQPLVPGGPAAAVQAYDEFGRVMQIPLEGWRQLMLDNAALAQDDPEKLYDIVLQLLEHRLPADALPVAKRLHAIDPDAERGTVMLGIALLSTQDAMGAAQLFADYLTAQQQRGEPPSAVVLANHAKALVAMGNEQAGEAILWQAMQADPNQENGLAWFGAIGRERGGEAGYLAAMQRVAALPGAWRPQVWLARAALDSDDLSQAKTLYAEALERAGSPAPAALLQSMSGDLGKHGDLADLLALTRPEYVAGVHGLAVGNNLIKASLDTGRIEEAQALVEELQRMARPDWANTLEFWETQVRAARLAKQPPLAEAPPEVTALAIDGPVWLPHDAPSRGLFANPLFVKSPLVNPPLVNSPSASQPGGPKLLFLAASVGYSEQPAALQGMLPDAPGRLSRALPLFLAESAFLHMRLETNAILPWVKGHGFAVMGAEWTDADAAEYARSVGAVAAVVLHIQQVGDTREAETNEAETTKAEAIEATMRLVRADGPHPETTAMAASAQGWVQTGRLALTLWSRLANSLLPIVKMGNSTQPLAATTAAPLDPARYLIPTGPALSNYLLRLEQLLAVRCAGTEAGGRTFLSGEREIVRGQLELALSLPPSLPLRLILHETLLRMRDLRPEIVAEFRAPVLLLQQRYPLADAAANAILEQQLGKIYPAGSQDGTGSSQFFSAEGQG